MDETQNGFKDAAQIGFQRDDQNDVQNGFQTDVQNDAVQKTVLIGVTGGVAIYKACEVVRGLQKAGFRVKVMMTEHATHFIDPVLFRSLTREEVAVDLFDNPRDPIHHISLAQEADVVALVPCTANVIGKVANGIADDLLTTTVMATTAPVIISPAMNVNMFESAANQENLETLKRRGFTIVEPADGYLACGDVGRGKLADVGDIVAAIIQQLLNLGKAAGSSEVGSAQCSQDATNAKSVRKKRQDMVGRRVLITAGPTREPIDAVRYISNPSTGKMGYAFAEAARDRGAEVVVVAGPVSLEDPEGVRVIHVTRALEMFDAVEEEFENSDIGIFTAAVSDMRPANPSERKLKKGMDDESLAKIDLVENPDILRTMGEKKNSSQVVVGFAAETDDIYGNVERKLFSKHADMIVGNIVSDSQGFGQDDDEVIIAYLENRTDLLMEQPPKLPKRILADYILDTVVDLHEILQES